MSEQATAAATEEKPWIATLFRGTRFVLKGVHFENGVDKPVTEEMKKKLEKKAFDPITVDDETDEDGNVVVQKRPKFRFRKVGEAAPAASARGRRRRRAAED